MLHATVSAAVCNTARGVIGSFICFNKFCVYCVFLPHFFHFSALCWIWRSASTRLQVLPCPPKMLQMLTTTCLRVGRRTTPRRTAKKSVPGRRFSTKCAIYPPKRHTVIREMVVEAISAAREAQLKVVVGQLRAALLVGLDAPDLIEHESSVDLKQTRVFAQPTK